MEELLKIAKEKYPVGTVFKSAYSGNILTSTDIPKICITDRDIEVRCENGILAFLYENSTWAEIISKPEIKEESMTLLEEAKKRFPVGTKFVPAHIDTNKSDRYCIIVEDGEFVEDEEEQSIAQELKDGRNWDSNRDPKYGTTNWGRLVYNQGNWARIIEEPKTRIVESLNECKAEDPLIYRTIVEDPYSNATLVPGKVRVVRTFGQIKEDNFFKTATESLCKMLEAKNKAYGESALKPLDIFAKHHPYGSRLDEKLARIKNSSELRKNDVADIIGGLFLICKDKGWSDFTDLID